MSIPAKIITSGENIECWLLDDTISAEAHNMAAIAYELYGLDSDDNEEAFLDFKYEVIEADLTRSIEEAIDKAVNAMWTAIRNGEYDPR